MSLSSVLEVPLALLRPAALLFGALIAAACRDPSPTTGTLVVSVTGLPTGAIGAVRVSGPNQFFQIVPATITLENLEPGEYIVTRDTVTFQSARYGVAVMIDTVTITRGRTETSGVPYAIASGSLTITTNGLPPGTAPGLRIKGPLPSGTENSNILPGQTITAMRPGQYEITSDTTLTALGDRFAAIKFRDTVVVPAALTAVQANVVYALASGTLDLTVSGLPSSGTLQPVTVTGPGGYLMRTGQSLTMRGLVPGTYSIAATDVNGTCPDVFASSSPSQTRDVTVGLTSTATVTYAQSTVSAANLNLRIDKVYLTQASQNPDGTVPLLSGKQALLRVFGIANQCNTAKPSIRVTVSTMAQAIIAAPEDSVRVLPLENSLAYSWNVPVPASAMQVGMTVVAEMDFNGAIAEANESDNRYPGPTGAMAIDVRNAPVVGLRFVPITQTVNGVVLTGNVDSAGLIDFSRKIHPVGTYDLDIREPYTTTRTLLASGTGWAELLADLNGVRAADASTTPTARYYYGVVRVSYTSGGVAGIGYVPGRTSMGWDDLTRSGSQVMAHELGHNFGRLHTPCGGPAQPDPNYPSTGAYANGKIGALGWDPAVGLKSVTLSDVMGYCNNQWISDYTYMGMLNRLLGIGSPSLPYVAGAVQPSLLVWGRIENGQLVLEPTFELSARPEAPAPGPNKITATDASGAELFSVNFAGDRVADLPGDHEHFAFTVPLSALRGRQLSALTLSARGKTVRSVASTDVASDPSVLMTSAGQNKVRLRWDATRFPVVMVRDPVKGHVLSFARGGDATIVTGRSELELNFSNRVRSSRRLTQFK